MNHWLQTAWEIEIINPSEIQASCSLAIIAYEQHAQDFWETFVLWMLGQTQSFWDPDGSHMCMKKR